MSYGRGFEGVAYEATKDLDLTEVAKRVRVNLKNAQDMECLPPEMTWTVNVRRFAGGQAIDVVLTGMPDSWTYKQPGLAEDYLNRVPRHGGLTEQAEAAREWAKAMLQSYNRDDSDVQTDYFDVHFYGDVTLHDEAAQWWDNQERHVRECQRKASEERRAQGLPTKGRDAQYAASRVASRARAEYQANHPRPYSDR